MFCTKCGKKLYDGDSFCAYCGAKVREELMFKTEAKPKEEKAKYEEVVFNPPFRFESEERTKTTAKESQVSKDEAKKESVVLDWNLDGFPSRERKKDDFEINWDAVIERRRENKPVNVERIVPETGFKTDIEEEKETLAEKVKVETKPETVEAPALTSVEELSTEKEETTLSIEELEKALFGGEDFSSLEELDPGVTVEYKALQEKRKAAQEKELLRKEEEHVKAEELPKVEEVIAPKTEMKSEDLNFFTFNSKRDAFQELLDKERARIAALESERDSQWNEITPKNGVEYVPKKIPKFEEVFKEPKLPLVPPTKFVSVTLPPLTAMVMADAPENQSKSEEAETKIEAFYVVEPEYEVVLPPLTARVEVEKEEREEEANPFLEKETEDSKTEVGAEQNKTAEKTKLRYSDIFPVDDFASVSNDKSDKSVKAQVIGTEDEEEDDYDYDESRGNGFLKALIVILSIIVVIELVIVGVKFIAPNSKLTSTVDNLIGKVTSLFVEDDGSEPVINTEENVIQKYINQLSGMQSNIGSVGYDENLKFDLDEAYAFDGVNSSSDFQDISWNGSSEETNGYLIIEAIIDYYDNWKNNNSDESIVGVNQVLIGEVRTGSNGYYVLNKVVYAGAEGDVIEKTETVYLEAAQEKIIVKEVKEETA